MRLRLGFGWPPPPLPAFQTELLEKQPDLGRTAAEAGQGFEYGDGFMARVRRMFSQVRFNGFTMRLEATLGAVKRPLFQGVYTPGLIPFQVSASGIAADAAQASNLVMRYSRALQPGRFHPRLQPWRRMMIALGVQRLVV